MQFDFNVAANGAQFIDVAGKFFKYKSGIGAIRVRNSTGGYVDILPGQGVSGLEFSSLSVTDISGAANKGVLLAGAYEFRDDRISGDVNVIDNSKAVSESGMVFYDGQGVAAVVGQTSYVELFNPVASGKKIAISSYEITTDVSGWVALGKYLTDTNNGSKFMTSKLFGSAAGIGKLNCGTNAVPLVNTADGFVRMLTANSPFVRQLREPIVLKPGFGYLIQAGTINAALTVAFETTEY